MAHRSIPSFKRPEKHITRYNYFHFRPFLTATLFKNQMLRSPRSAEAAFEKTTSLFIYFREREEATCSEDRDSYIKGKKELASVPNTF